MKVKTIDLIGPALDWAVCVAEGNSPVINPVRFGATRFGMFDSPHGYTIKEYSTDWAHGGPIIEQERISCHPLYISGATESGAEGAVPNGWACFHTPRLSWQSVRFRQAGPTLLIAAMRCYVASKLGDEVEVPDQLGKT